MLLILLEWIGAAVLFVGVVVLNYYALKSLLLDDRSDDPPRDDGRWITW